MARMGNLLKEGFDRLFARFGQQGWWPGDTPFEVMVGAILTQNTNWKNVERAMDNIKSEDLLSPKKLYDLHPSTLARLIRPAGFYRLKAGRLKSFLRFFIDGYNSSVARMAKRSIDEMRAELLSVRGIGPETADSILLYALDKPIFVVDAYTKRILERHSLCSDETTYDELQALFMDALPRDVRLFNEYHALIVRVAKEYCRKQPRCDDCPLNGWNS